MEVYEDYKECSHSLIQMGNLLKEKWTINSSEKKVRKKLAASS